jgi:hypothetical protein
MVETGGGGRCSAPLRIELDAEQRAREKRERETAAAAAVSAHAALLSRSQLRERGRHCGCQCPRSRSDQSTSRREGGRQQATVQTEADAVATRPSRRPAQPPFIRSWRGRDTGHGSGSVGAQPPAEDEEGRRACRLVLLGPVRGTGRERGLSCGLWLSGLASSGSLVFVSPVFPSLAACGPGVADDCRVRAIAPIRPRANECGRLRSRVRVACAAAL